MYPHPATESLFALCRPGMEGDCAGELTHVAAGAGVGGWCRTGPGWVAFTSALAEDWVRLAEAVHFADLVFVRQWMAGIARLDRLPADDRATPIAAAVSGKVSRYRALRVEHPDSDEARPLARLAKALHRPIAGALARHGVVEGADGPVLHVVLLDGGEARIGLSDPANASPWPGGIPRLRVPRSAPSRSVTKLEEAVGVLLTAREAERWLRPGATAVDLGAAPGGWSWFMARRGLHVTAVDNARMDQRLLEEYPVTHCREDGFRFRPRRAVDWLLCDMVEQPHQIVRLVDRWFERGDCRRAMFNLKLPMKRRWATVHEHLEALRPRVEPEGRIAAKQLYHDREEVTVFMTAAPPG